MAVVIERGAAAAGVVERRAVVDWVIALTAAAAVLFGSLIAPPGATELDLLGYALAVGAALALGFRTQAPVAVLVFITACVLAFQLGGYPGLLPVIPLVVALFTAANGGHRLQALPLGLTALFGGLAIDLWRGDEPARAIIQRWLLLAGWLVAAKLLGEVYRHWRGYLREVEKRAADAERTREETGLRRAGEERLRIARDLHDSLTHNISVIKVQAGVAVHLARKRGEEVPPPLLAIQDASREAMRELRATLEVLRAPGESYGPGLRLLPELVERARGAGLSASITVVGVSRALPAEVDATAYRIVQEALTNVTRHAGSGTAEVRVEYGPTLVAVQIDDNGDGTPTTPPTQATAPAPTTAPVTAPTTAQAAAPAPTTRSTAAARVAALRPGVGLTGMAERVAAVGGRLEYGPRADRGFRVRAELPVQVPAASPA